MPPYKCRKQSLIKNANNEKDKERNENDKD